MRYQGQWRSLEVRIGSGAGSLKNAVETFHEEHERQFAFRQDSQPVEIYQLHLRAVGKTPKPQFVPSTINGTTSPAPVDYRQVYFNGTWTRTPIYQRDDLHAGMKLEGPAVIDQLDSTTVVPPEASASIDEWLNIRISLPTTGEEA